jgi:hypothetical protein
MSIEVIEHDLCHKTADTNYKHSYLGLSFVLKIYASLLLALNIVDL